MKKIQLQSIALVTIMALTVVSGACCTSFLNTTTSGSASPSPPPDNLAGAIDDFYKQKNYTVNRPCYMTKKNDTVTYQALVTDPQTVNPRHLTNVTVLLTTNKTAANEAYDIADANYRAFQQSHTSYKTSLHLLSPQEMSSLRLYGATTTGYDYLNKADMSQYYQVLSALGTEIT